MNKFYLLNYNNWTLQPLINAENKSLKKKQQQCIHCIRHFCI